jgi:hypothetical protein
VDAQARGVRHQHAHRDGRIGDAGRRRKLPRLEVGVDVAIQVDPALVDQPQRRRGRDHLADRADRKQRVGVDGIVRPGFANAEADGVHDLAAPEHGDRDAGHVMVGHAFGQRPCGQGFAGLQHGRP